MSEERVRIDVWLWRARFAKTRAAAARLVSEGGVRVIRQDGASRALDKPSAEIGPGDKILFPERGAIRSVAVKEHRRPARAAGRGAQRFTATFEESPLA